MACKSINLYLFSVMSVALTHKTAIKKLYILDSSSCLSQSETFSSYFCTLISNVASSLKSFLTAYKMFLILSSPLSKKYFLKCTSLSFPQYAMYPYILVCVIFVCPRPSNSKSIPLFLLCNNHFDSEIDFFSVSYWCVAVLLNHRLGKGSVHKLTSLLHAADAQAATIRESLK